MGSARNLMSETSQNTNTHPACEDCGKPSNGNRYMHVQVSGLFQRLCSDCLEEANLMETIYSEPCTECRGSGTTWEGMNCEECDGSGTLDY